MTTLDESLEVFDFNHSIKVNAGGTIDLNLNQMIQFNEASIKSFADHTNGASAEGPIVYKDIQSKKPFSKLFPVDTIVKANRPEGAGIKHAILGDILEGSWTDPKQITYRPVLGNTYRTYYSSAYNYYKYWVGKEGQHAALKIKYNATVYPKNVRCNKIVLKFETAHTIPSKWYIYGNDLKLKEGTSIPTTGFNAGVVTIYWTGPNHPTNPSTWSTNEADLDMSSTTTFSSIAMGATHPAPKAAAIADLATSQGGGYIAVIELAPHLVYDITSDLIDFTLNKETSSSTEDLLAVGNVTANSLSLNLLGNRGQDLIYKVYSKLNASPISADNIYIIKNAEVKVFYKVYNLEGDKEDEMGKYFKLNQGIFYIDSWDISTSGQVSITALDSAKILQEILCPQMLCENYNMIAIIRRMLDSVGFTNYNINYNTNPEKEKSISKPNYWWSNGNDTVWSLIQDICRDSQMMAFVDNNGILQFYTRDFIFDEDRSVSYQFRNEPDGATLSNIVSIDKKVLPGVNNVRVTYYTAFENINDKESGGLVDIGSTWLAAGAIRNKIEKENSPLLTKYMEIDATTISNPDFQQVALSFSGYFLIDAEVIEYDAIQYEFKTKDPIVVKSIPYAAGAWVPVDITSETDLSKYEGLAEPSTTNDPRIYPNYKYRIKTRGAFNTSPEEHTPQVNYSSWTVYDGLRWVVG